LKGLKKIEVVKTGVFLAAAGLLLGICVYGAFAEDQRILGCRPLSEKKKEALSEARPVSAQEVQLLWNNEALPYDRALGAFCLPQTLEEGWSGYLRVVAQGENYPLYLSREEWEDKSAALREARVLSLYGLNRQDTIRLQVVATALPVMEISTTAPAEELEGEAKGSLRLFWLQAPEREDRLIFSRLCYHVRGSGSLSYEKKNYTVSLKDDEGRARHRDLLGLRDDDDWKLFSLALDDTLCREKTANDLWNRMAARDGSPPSNEMRYVELYMDGEYRGVYTLAPRLDQKTYGLTEEGRLYKYARTVELWAPYTLNTLEGKQYLNWDDRVKVLWPKEYREGIWGPLNQYFGQFFWADGMEADRETAFAAVKMKNLADTALYKQVVYMADCAQGHNMLYLQYGPGEGIYRVPYDNDQVFGLSVMEPVGDYVSDIVPDREVQALYRLDPVYTQRLMSKRWNQLRGQAFSDESIAGLWSQNSAYIRDTGGLAHNAARWGASPEAALREGEALLRLERERMAYLDGYMQAYLPPEQRREEGAGSLAS